MSLPLHAEETIKIEPKQDTMHPVAMFFLVEGMLGINAWMASENPRAYGVVGALLFPLAAGGQGDLTATEQWVGLIGAESIAVYNLSIDDEKTSKSEIFKNNMIAWHLFAGALGITSYLVGDTDSNESLSLKPTAYGGAQLVYNYKF